MHKKNSVNPTVLLFIIIMCSVTKLCLTLCDPIDYGMPSIPVLCYLSLLKWYIIDSKKKKKDYVNNDLINNRETQVTHTESARSCLTIWSPTLGWFWLETQFQCIHTKKVESLDFLLKDPRIGVQWTRERGCPLSQVTRKQEMDSRVASTYYLQDGWDRGH